MKMGVAYVPSSQLPVELPPVGLQCFAITVPPAWQPHHLAHSDTGKHEVIKDETFSQCSHTTPMLMGIGTVHQPSYARQDLSSAQVFSFSTGT